jgi:hypothetical protein
MPQTRRRDDKNIVFLYVTYILLHIYGLAWQAVSKRSEHASVTGSEQQIRKLFSQRQLILYQSTRRYIPGSNIL